MKKNLWIVVLAVVVIVVAVVAWMPKNKAAAFDPQNATYNVGGTPVALVNGNASTPAAPGSATQITTKIFTTTSGDLNGDGKQDAAVILVQNPGGSGTFYYVAAAINGANGAQGTNAVLLGDRIAPDTLEIKNGQIIANYADRKPGDPMTAKPSVAVSKYLNVSGLILAESARIAGAGERCGGNMLNAPVCTTGYHCAPEPGSHLPFGDVGGTCVSN